MAEDLCISNGSKEEKYRTLLPQIKCLIADENDLIANLANVAAALKETFGFFWVGFLLEKGEELVLGHFQGPDVDAFPGHIACSSLSRSEIVVPLLRTGGEVWGVLDVDCESLNGFDDVDAYFLRELCSCL